MHKAIMAVKKSEDCWWYIMMKIGLAGLLTYLKIIQ
jgi:hypothetical protein